MVQDRRFLLSSADLVALFGDWLQDDFWHMNAEVEGDTEDWDEEALLEAKFELLEKHRDEKIKAVQEMLEGSTVVAYDCRNDGDFVVVFSIGVVLEVFQMME